MSDRKKKATLCVGTPERGGASCRTAEPVLCPDEVISIGDHQVMIFIDFDRETVGVIVRHNTEEPVCSYRLQHPSHPNAGRQYVCAQLRACARKQGRWQM